MARSSRQLSGPLRLQRQALAAEEVEIVIPRRRPVHVALEILADGRGAARVDRRSVLREVLVVRLVEAVALVGERAERRQDERVDDEPRDDRAIGISTRLLLGDDLFNGDENGRRRARDVGVHVRVADIARAATTVLITAEKIVSEEKT